MRWRGAEAVPGPLGKGLRFLSGVSPLAVAVSGIRIWIRKDPGKTWNQAGRDDFRGTASHHDRHLFDPMCAYHWSRQPPSEGGMCLLDN